MSIENQNLAFFEITGHLRRSNTKGAGDLPPEYLLSQFETWVNKVFPESENSILQNQHSIARDVFRGCRDLSEKYLRSCPRINGPEGEKDYRAFSYRSAAIIVQEFRILDPMVIATCYLANIYGKLLSRSDQNKFNTLLSTTFPNRAFTDQLKKNLEHFAQLEDRYRNIANRIVTDPEPCTGTRHYIEDAHDHGFTPASYEEFKSLVTEIYINDPNNQLHYFSIPQMIEYTANGFSDNTASTGQIGGLATMLTMMAQAIDKHRYPRHPSDDQKTNDAVLEDMKDALNVSYNLLPLARALNIPGIVRELQLVVADIMFPKQWSALQTAIKEMSQSYANTHRTSRSSKKDDVTYFELQRRMNCQALHRKITEVLESENIAASYVDEVEFQRRTYEKLKTGSDEPLLSSWEYTVLTGKKSAGSIFDKWLGDCRQGKLNNPKFIGGCQPGQEQTALTEKFQDPKVWIKYLKNITDAVRATVVLGEDLAMLFALPEDHDQVDTTLSKTIQYVYLDEDMSKRGSTPINHTQTNRVGKNGEKLSEKGEAESWNTKPHFEREKLFFELHQLLCLSPQTKDVDNVIFEIIIESISRYEQKTSGNALHCLYKFKKNNGLEASSDEIDFIVKLFCEIQKKLFEVIYGEAVYE